MQLHILKYYNVVILTYRINLIFRIISIIIYSFIYFLNDLYHIFMFFKIINIDIISINEL